MPQSTAMSRPTDWSCSIHDKEGSELAAPIKAKKSEPVADRHKVRISCFYKLRGSVATCRIMSVSSSTDSSQPLTSHA